MAEDLKPMLTKVLSSEGKKKFFFAYGTGKRKDGKGEGDLAVGATKLKRPEIEAELGPCKEFFEGFCWTGQGPDDAETIYFLGKRLANTVVTKMKLTAKTTAGRQYDFQLPGPEEEARAAALVEGDGSESPAAETSVTTPIAAKGETETANLESAYQARVKGLLPDLKKAIVTGTPAGNEAKLRFNESQLHAGKKEFAQAMSLLDVVEDEIKKALATHTGTDGAEPTDGETTTDSEAESDEARWSARRQAIETLYLDALKKQPANAGKLRAVLAFADGKAEASDFAKALQGLDSLEKLLEAPTATDAKAAAALQQWQAACAEVKHQLRTVQGKIVKAKKANSAKAVIRLESIVKNLAGQPSTQQDVVELEDWIRQDDAITRVEKKPNPWGIEVKVRDTLLPVLAALKPRLTA